ncbi:MAG: acetyl ornithine aminotransferase family protein [Euryarchaeota archaeon]|nr:acetyl ornithine aminotransferase family protein [Euryarchaeota archaeon]
MTGQESRPQIRVAPPGPADRRIIDEDALYMATTTKASPVAARMARGTVVLSEDGNVFLDFTSGVGVTNTGHSHPAVVKAIQEQAAKFLHFAGTDFYYDVQSSLAKELAHAVPGTFAKKTFYTNSGTESNEAAIKIVKWSTRRPLLLAFTHAFHGRTQGTLALSSSKAVHKERFFPSMPGAFAVPYPNPYRNPFNIDGYDEPEALSDAVLSLVEDLLDAAAPASEVGAFFVEPIQGEGGYVIPPKGFFAKLKKILDGHGILMVADEVQTGFGRTGKMFAMEHFGVQPQLTTMAKAMGSGVPIGACVFDAKLDFAVSGAHSNTYGGNPIACAAGLATLRVMREEKLVERSQKMGDVLHKELEALQTEFPRIGDVRGLGLMQATEFVKDAKKTPDKDTRDRVIHEAFLRGLLLLPCGKSSIRYIPPLVVTADQIRGAMDVLRASLKAAAT